MQRESGLPLSNYDLHLVLNEAVQITLPDNTKYHVSIFASSGPYGFMASHLCTQANIEAALGEPVGGFFHGFCVIYGLWEFSARLLNPVTLRAKN
jgi:hypothetical protein